MNSTPTRGLRAALACCARPLALLALLPSLATAQPPTAPAADSARAGEVSRTFFTRRDLAYAGVAVAASAATSIFDERIARWAQRSSVQGSASRTETFESLTRVNETPLTILAVAAYGAGRLTGNRTVADVGLHTAESLVLTIGVSEVVRGAIGRTRPREAMGDAFRFEPGEGFTEFDARSFPSLHTSAAFAVASTLAAEMDIRDVRARRWATPVLYGLATVPGLTRIYLDQHWASDVVAGAFTGALLGARVARQAHGHRVNRIDRALLGTVVAPDGHGGMRVGFTGRF